MREKSMDNTKIYLLVTRGRFQQHPPDLAGLVFGLLDRDARMTPLSGAGAAGSFWPGEQGGHQARSEKAASMGCTRKRQRQSEVERKIQGRSTYSSEKIYPARWCRLLRSSPGILRRFLPRTWRPRWTPPPARASKRERPMNNCGKSQGGVHFGKGPQTDSRNTERTYSLLLQVSFVACYRQRDILWSLLLQLLDPQLQGLEGRGPCNVVDQDGGCGAAIVHA